MTWEPKQGEMVFYKINGGPLRGTGLFVCMYQGKHLLDDEGDFILVSSIERLVIEKEPEITVGSVWEIKGCVHETLTVVTNIINNEIAQVYNSSSGVISTKSFEGFYEIYKPRPDKIGMAPAFIKSSYGMIISSTAFRNAEHASKNLITDTLIAWPANNSMWVIVDK